MNRVFRRLTLLFHRRRHELELQNEIDLHLSMDVRERIDSGQSPEEARRAAYKDFGSVLRAVEDTREAWGWTRLELFVHDMRHAVRMCRKNPGFAAICVLTLAVGIGATTAIFAVLDGVLLKPLPYPDSERIVAVLQSAPALNLPHIALSAADYFTFREENRTFQYFGLWSAGTATVTGIVEPEQIATLTVTHGILEALGIQPFSGRWFSEADDSRETPETAILTFGYWQRRFGGDAAVIGRTIVVDAKERRIIGVMPRRFDFLDRKPELILPFRLERSNVHLGGFDLQGLARLQRNVTLEQANADVARMIPLVITRFPPPRGISARMFADSGFRPSVRPLKSEVVGDVGKVLWVLMGMIAIVLLIACANVANLLLVRAERRRHELAIRAAIGGSRARIVRALLSESVMLSLAGGAAGIVIAEATVRLVAAVRPVGLPRIDDISIDPGVLLFSFLISAITGVLFGLLPAWKYARSQPGSVPAGGARTGTHTRERHRVRSTLVIVQIALGLILLISSGLMIRTFITLKSIRPGFTRPEAIQTFRIFVPEAQVREPERVLRMQHDILQKITALQGVSAAALASSLPMERDGADILFVEDRTDGEGRVPAIRRNKSVAPGFWQTIGNPLVAGRDFEWTDLYEKRHVVLISDNLARELFNDPRAALGKRVRQNRAQPWMEIVGVTGNVYDNGANHEPPTTVYWPVLVDEGGPAFVSRGVVYAIRTERAGSDSLLKELHQAVWAVNPDLPLANVQTLNDVYRSSMARTSFALVMLVIAAAMALLLGIIGVYGVVSYAVSQRTREIGIRIALGAGSRDVKRIFIRQGLRLAMIGSAGGLAASATVLRLMSSLLFGVNPIDPPTYLAVTAGLVAAAVAASCVPAHKATTVDPVEAIRAE